jgi:hypothetical protein
MELIMKRAVLHELIHNQGLRAITCIAQKRHQVGMPYPAHQIHLTLVSQDIKLSVKLSRDLQM